MSVCTLYQLYTVQHHLDGKITVGPWHCYKEFCISSLQFERLLMWVKCMSLFFYWIIPEPQGLTLEEDATVGKSGWIMQPCFLRIHLFLEFFTACYHYHLAWKYKHVTLPFLHILLHSWEETEFGSFSGTTGILYIV